LAGRPKGIEMKLETSTSNINFVSTQASRRQSCMCELYIHFNHLKHQ